MQDKAHPNSLVAQGLQLQLPSSLNPRMLLLLLLLLLLLRLLLLFLWFICPKAVG
jgi:hypothetical protein